MHHKRNIFITCVILATMLFFIFLKFERSLSLKRLDGSSKYSFWQKTGWLILEIIPLDGGDNGFCQVKTSFKEKNIGLMQHCYYDYDTLQNKDPLIVNYSWVDGDLWPDLVIRDYLGKKQYYFSTISEKIEEYQN